eukprot:gnl/TRDRNA2_/TRDRNA2_67895_c0_seq1.p1 gnl/TRDRNA2_/TRDRNA2_67895_c0~~gnl/TRDRNA2_/TRDRNA2_67895_c0_seq1.p1  ORF type:complete len:238 (-),score=26.01 gnl/TRDRNA2_/TRDRNA2_67895_c0_seq1:65-778(-)
MHGITLIAIVAQVVSAEVNTPLNVLASSLRHSAAQGTMHSWLDRPLAVAAAPEEEEDGWIHASSRHGMHGRRSRHGTKPFGEGYDDYEEDVNTYRDSRFSDADTKETGYDLPMDSYDEFADDGSESIGTVDSPGRPNLISPKNELYWISRGMLPKWRKNMPKHKKRVNRRNWKDSDYESGTMSDDDLETDLLETSFWPLQGFATALMVLLSGIGAILSVVHLRRGIPSLGKEPLLGV